MSYEDFMDTSCWAVDAMTFGMPVWLMLWPPRSVRGWPVLFRPVIATVCSEALIYIFSFCVIYPVADAYGRAHPSACQCYPSHFLPLYCTWIATGGLALGTFAVSQFALYVTGTDADTWPWTPRA